MTNVPPGVRAEDFAGTVPVGAALQMEREALAAERLTLLLGDCREVMAGMAEGSVDAIVTDPPYDLTAGKKGGSGEASVNLESPYGRARITTGGGGFMGKAWDSTGVAFDVATWSAALRVLKPGGHLVAFGGTRTHHRLMCAIEDAGFEIRDCLMWLFGSGFPKSLDVSKAIDKAAGAEREIVGRKTDPRYNSPRNRPVFSVEARGYDDGTTAGMGDAGDITAPATDAAREWEGWGTALKPAYEPIILARKPFKGTVAGNVQAHGTGALNIDASRIGTALVGNGRWPANVLLDEAAARQLDAQSGESLSSGGRIGNAGGTNVDNVPIGVFSAGQPGFLDRGGASRFFYTAKSSRREREYGLDGLEPTRRSDGREKDIENPRLRTNERRNDHPTVKPVDLMRWLCRLVTPPGGLILDPFMGSGSTGMAALDEGFRFVGIDMDEHYIEIAKRRIERRHLLDDEPLKGRLL